LTPAKTERGKSATKAVSDTSVTADLPRNFFRRVLDAAPDGLIIVNVSGTIAFANAEAEALFGYRREELLGRPIEILLPERQRLRHEHHRRGYAQAPRVRAMGVGLELTGLRSDGTEFPAEISLSPIQTPAGTLVVSAIRDVTERRRFEQELTAARQAAERANKANTAFLSAASHDLRQPVQALSLLTGALRRTVKEPLALEMIESQQDSLEAMTSLLNSLLDISRLDAGAFEPILEDFPLQDLIGRLAADMVRQARHKDLLFEADDCELAVRSDPDLLGEIIQNFVSNAIRYTEEGWVRLSCTHDGAEVAITVADTGIGIPQDQLDLIFREFHQVRSDGRKREGVGLGLAIASRLADLLGHRISVESTQGEGSRFSVHVPLAPHPQRTQAVSDEAASAAPAPAGLVVIVEDDAQIARAWERLLEAEGYRVVTAASSSGARSAVHNLVDPPNLIISDFHLMDSSNGIEAVSAIRNDLGRCVPAFIVTGDTSRVPQDVEKLQDCRILKKPIGPDELLDLVREAIARES
jgi:two-component system, sensor histidine kinase